ncbi:hypothetical protein [Halosimplex marinum]|uniref:hypothetical protein n=1 Tax=Halosimplex marinum TaxID=3396620 RepID=UPI003F546E57
MRRRRSVTALALAALAVAAVAAPLVAGSVVGAVPGGPSGSGTGPSVVDPLNRTSATPSADRLVSPAGVEGAVWPYTSKRRSTAARTLALNVVVRGDADRVRRAFEDRSGRNWTAVDGEGNVTEPVWDGSDAPGPEWGRARGSARYTYVAAADGRRGRWVESTYQLGVGAYLGQRTHVRAYPAHVGNWTALQVHTEYWDWYRLRHTVTGVEAGAEVVERDLRDERFVAGLTREYHGFGGGGSDGWITVVEFVPAVLVGAALPVAVRRRRLPLAETLIPAALAGVVLGVRSAGVAAELLLPAVDPNLIAAALYPVLVAGPPLAVRALGRDRDPDRVALLAAGGLGAGFLLDFGLVSVQVVPIRLVVHRLALLGAIAVFAYGVARDDRRTTAVGLGTWVLGLAGAVLGVF